MTELCVWQTITHRHGGTTRLENAYCGSNKRIAGWKVDGYEVADADPGVNQCLCETIGPGAQHLSADGVLVSLPVDCGDNRFCWRKGGKPVDDFANGF